MAVKESTFKNMVLTLFLVTLSTSAAVGYVYELTKEPKAEAQRLKQVQAVKDVVPQFDNNPLEEKTQVTDEKGTLVFYPAKKEGQLVGTAVETSTDKGFGGQIRLMVGFLPEGTIYDIAVLQHTETPGLGDKIEKKKSGFAGQFKDKNPRQFNLRVKKDGGDVDGITAATISSRAFVDAVQRAYESYLKSRNKGTTE